MFVEQLRAAVKACPRSGLDALTSDVWRAYGADVLTEAEASDLCEAIASRRAPPADRGHMPTVRRVGSRPRTSASLERRRSWAAGSWMPPSMAAAFTQAEAAALAVIIREITTTGRCGLPIGAIAARAGVCATIVKRAVREARARGILHVEERRVAYDRNLPNLLTIISRELALWVRTRARIEGQAPGGITVPAATILYPSSPARPASATRRMGNRWGGGTDRTTPTLSRRTI